VVGLGGMGVGRWKDLMLYFMVMVMFVDDGDIYFIVVGFC